MVWLIMPEELANASWLDGLRIVDIFLACFLVEAAAIVYLMLRAPTVYLVDYAGFRTPSTCRVTLATFLEVGKLAALNEEEHRSLGFMMRLLERSGIGEETCVPPATHYIPAYNYKYCTLHAAREEFELVAFSAIDDLLAKTGIAPGRIDILIVNCSLFCPIPSLAAVPGRQN